MSSRKEVSPWAPWWVLERLLVVLALLCSACEDEPVAAPPAGPGPLGSACSRTEDCASRLCVQVGPAQGVCTSFCDDASTCPAAPNWVCAQPREISHRVCACRATGTTEICGDGLDNDCDGNVDDCRMCNGIPVNDDDPRHCGACNNACSAAQNCIEGQCRCPGSGQVSCGGECVNTTTSARHCGACGNDCGAGRSCSAGQCVCDGGRTYCAGSGCADTAGDITNCGACGKQCASGLTCIAGECACPDASAPDYCDGAGCVDFDSDETHCGSCTGACSGVEQCVDGACKCPDSLPDTCAGSCANLKTDAANCGECGGACGAQQSCQDGKCGCSFGLTACGAACASTSTDSANCGECGHACLPGELCESGVCQCPSGLVCGGVCVSHTDPANCGVCGNTCSTSQFCNGQACECFGGGLTKCGSECVDVLTSSAFCGNCTTACGANQVCDSGTCRNVTCTAGSLLCQNGDILICNSAGTGTSLQAHCTGAQFCSQTGTSASCEPDVCVQGTPLCQGTIATVCSADGSRVEPGGTNCQATNRACEDGACKPIVCTPGEEACSGQTARHCNALGTVLTQQTCLASEYCRVSGISYCAVDLCEQGKIACDGNVATTCNADGSGYTGSRTDCSTQGHTCRAGYCEGFGTATVLDGPKRSSEPKGAMDAAGNVLIAWSSGTDVLFPRFSRFNAATRSWSAAANIPGVSDSSYPQAVVATSGNNFVVVYGSDARQLHASVYTSSTGSWSAAKRIDDDPNTPDPPRVVVDGKDVVTVVWRQGSSLWSARRNPANDTWTTTNIGAGPSDISLGADAAGNTLLTWAGTNAAYQMRFESGASAWSAATPFFTGAINSSRSALNVRADGRALAAWIRSGSPSAVQFAAYSPAPKTWSAAGVINGGSVNWFQLASAGNSRVGAVFNTPGILADAAWFNDTTGAWDPVVRLFPGLTDLVMAPFLGVGPDSSGIVVASNQSRVRATRYDPALSSWSAPYVVGGAYINSGFGVWIDANGNATVAWLQSQNALGDYSVAVNRFVKYR